jgi:hypothetical protein
VPASISRDILLAEMERDHAFFSGTRINLTHEVCLGGCLRKDHGALLIPGLSQMGKSAGWLGK